MAARSFWSRFTRLWSKPPISERFARRSRLRPNLEQLGERTLLSGYSLVQANGLLLVEVNISTPATQTPQQIQEPGSVAHSENTALNDLRQAAATEPVSVTLDFSGGAAGSNALGTAGSERLTVSLQTLSDNGAGVATNGISLDWTFQLGLVDQYLQRFIGRLESHVPDIVVVDGETRPWADNAPRDEGALPYLLETRFGQLNDRREVGGDDGLLNDASDGLLPMDGVSTPAIVPMKNEGIAAGPSLATIFRERLTGEEAGVEAPAGPLPECLVSYELEVTAPRTELLPLEDGSHALVAALVNDLPSENTATSPSESTNSEAFSIGAAVGIGSDSSANTEPLSLRPDSVSEPACSADEASPASAALDWPVNASAVRLIDFVFILGAVPLYWSSQGTANEDATRSQPIPRADA
jgi:hypothetical protein